MGAYTKSGFWPSLIICALVVAEFCAFSLYFALPWKWAEISTCLLVVGTTVFVSSAFMILCYLMLQKLTISITRFSGVWCVFDALVLARCKDTACLTLTGERSFLQADIAAAQLVCYNCFYPLHLKSKSAYAHRVSTAVLLRCFIILAGW